MADITNAEAIQITNTIVRPVAEDLRRTYYQLKAVKDQHGASINTLFPTDGNNIIDGRSNEGVSLLTSTDARKILLFANTFITAYEAEGIAAMTKPCVQKLEVR